MSDPPKDLTGKALSAFVADQVRERVRRTLKDAGWSDLRIGGAIELCETRVGGWWRAHHAPLYLLARREIPKAVRLRIVTELFALAEDGPDVAHSIEHDIAEVIRLAGEFLVEAGIALADGRIDVVEARRLIAKGRKLGAALDRIVDALHERAGLPRTDGPR